jgi:acyl carrier protein phosphodiesterase
MLLIAHTSCVRKNILESLTFFSKINSLNFLAHIYLSGDDEKLITGNFIGDYVKGKKFLKYPGKIREGIILHRRIDSFTDEHELFREVKKNFREEFGLYSGVVTDLIFDHLLASDWKNYHPLTLRRFARKTHAILLKNVFYLPPRVQGFLPVLIKNRRLESYAQKDGIQQTLDIMSRYTSLPPKAGKAIEIMDTNYLFIETRFTLFMNELIAFAESESGITIKKP